MNSLEKPIYRFEKVEVDASRGCLLCEGKEKHLRPKSFQVLLYLLENRERLVSKNELIEKVWKVSAVTDDVLVQCVKEIRRAIGDDFHNPQFIKTVPKAGYRFISPVEMLSNGTDSLQTEEITRIELEFEEDTDYSPIKSLQKLILAIYPIKANYRPVFVVLFITALISLIGLTVYLIPKYLFIETHSGETTLPQKPGKRSLAVMYFENQTGDTGLEWLREGLADMLITNLSRSSKLTVLSRQQLHLLLERNGYRQGDEILLENALELSGQARAEIVITGSFVRIGEKIRLDVQILDSRNGSLVATESLTVEKLEHLLTDIDLLSLKLTKHLGGIETDNRTNFADVMTDDLEAFRYYSLAMEKVQALHNKEAIELLEKAVALDQEFAMAHARIGYAYAVSWGYAEEGKPYLEKAYKLSNRLSKIDRLNIAAWYAIANLDYSSAIQTYREIIVEFPLETESYWRLGRLLAGEEQMEEAVEVLKKGLIIDPNDKDIYNTLGGIYSELGKHSEAIAARQRYVELAPDEPNAYDSLGLAYQWAGDYQSAIANYNRSLELDPNFEVALIHLANTRFQIGQYNEAINLIRRYIEIAPSDGEKGRGWENIAQIYLKKQNFDSAEKAAREVLKFNKEMVWSTFVSASEKGNTARAEKFEVAIFARASTNDRGARRKQRFEFYYRGYIALKKGQNEEAIANFREAIKRKPPIWNIEAYEDCLANAYLKLGRSDEALAEYQRILRLNPNYPLAQFHLAQVYEKKGLNEKARAAYQTFMKIWQKSDDDIPEVITAKKFINQS